MLRLPGPFALRKITVVLIGLFWINTAAAQIDPPRIPRALTPGKQHQLKTPRGPLAYRDETYSGSLWIVNRYPSLPAHDLIAERSRLTCSDSCILLTRPSKGTTLRDLDLTGVGDKPYRAGIKIGSTASDVLIERVAIRGFRSTLPKGYPNADGIATERGNARITLRHVSASDATDGCYDLKSTETVLDQVSATGCRYGFRLWGTGTATTLYADGNRNAHVYIKAGTAYTIERLYLAGPVPKYGDVYQDGKGVASLSIGWCSRPLVVHPGARKSVTLGPACR